MARILSITRTNSLDPGRRKKTLQNSFQIGPLSLSVMTICLIGFLALFYIIGTSMTSSKGFEAYQLEQQADELIEQNKALEIEASKLRAIDHLETSLNDSEEVFVPVTKVTTVRLPSKEVAVSGQ